jgi:hypothetical protein
VYRLGGSGAKKIHAAWTPTGKRPDFENYLVSEAGRDVYFDLEYLRQSRTHEGDFEDKDWELITAIAAVVEGDHGRPVSLYGQTKVDQPPVATDREGEEEVIKAFLKALFKWRCSRPDDQQGESNGLTAEPPSIRLFNYSGSGAEGRLWKKLSILKGKGSAVIPSHQDREELRDLLEYISESSSDEQSGRTYGEGIERFDLGRVVKRSYESFPLDKDSKWGLKVVERFLPGFSRPGSLVGSEDSMATWLRIKMLKDEGARLIDGDETPPEPCDASWKNEQVASNLRQRRLDRERTRLERSYKTYAEWDCRALWYLHRHLIALERANRRPNPVILGRRATLARHGLLFARTAGSTGGRSDPILGRRATSARHGLTLKKEPRDRQGTSGISP